MDERLDTKIYLGNPVWTVCGVEDLGIGEKLLLMRILNKECKGVEWPLDSGLDPLMDTCEHAVGHEGAMTSDKCFDHFIDHQFLKKNSASWSW